VYVTRGEKFSLTVRQVATGSDVQVLPPDEVRFYGLTFSPDGNYIYFVRSSKETFNYSFLYAMPVLGGAPRSLIRDIDTPVSFSPDGRLALTGSADRTAFLWEVSSGRRVHRLVGHSQGVRAVCFSPDGRLALTGGADHTAILWDVFRGAIVRRLEGHTNDVLSVSFSPDGTLALTGSPDGTAAFVFSQPPDYQRPEDRTLPYLTEGGKEAPKSQPGQQRHT